MDFDHASSESIAHSILLLTGKGISADVCCYNPATYVCQKDAPRNTASIESSLYGHCSDTVGAVGD
jgi:hypothetical protein